MFESEISFLKRKLPAFDVKWEIREAISQILSVSMSRKEANKIFAKLEESLAPRAGKGFSQIVRVMDSQFTNGSRVVIFVNKLREHFAGEIDGASGGGGKGSKPLPEPLRTSMRR